ncbi:hypothetical protein HK102_003343 [Quaeritorhiza haematococci]|nr:hypothetical protein HK102_003343 [Quaeritorhiza haematococci]
MLHIPLDFSLYRFQDETRARSCALLLFGEVTKVYPELRDVHVRSTPGDSKLYNVIQVTNPGSRLPLQFWANYFACLLFSNISVWFLPAREQHAIVRYSHQVRKFIVKTLKESKIGVSRADMSLFCTIGFYQLTDLELFGRHRQLLARMETNNLPGPCIFCSQGSGRGSSPFGSPTYLEEEELKHWTLAGNVFYADAFALGKLRRYVLTLDYQCITAATTPVSTVSGSIPDFHFFSPSGPCFVEGHRWSRAIWLVDTVLTTPLAFVASPIQVPIQVPIPVRDPDPTDGDVLTVNIVNHPDACEQNIKWNSVTDVMAMIKEVVEQSSKSTTHVSVVISYSETPAHQYHDALFLEKKVETLMRLCSAAESVVDSVDEIVSSYWTVEPTGSPKPDVRFTFVFFSFTHGGACMHVPKKGIKNRGLRLWKTLKKTRRMWDGPGGLQDPHPGLIVLQGEQGTVFRFYGSWFCPEDLIGFARKLLGKHRVFIGIVTNIPFRKEPQREHLSALYLENQASLEKSLRMAKQMNQSQSRSPHSAEPQIYMTEEARDQLERAARTNRTMLSMLAHRHHQTDHTDHTDHMAP